MPLYMRGIIVLSALALLGVGCTSPSSGLPPAPIKTPPATTINEPPKTENNKDSKDIIKAPEPKPAAKKYDGAMLGGSVSPLLDFTKTDYDQAVNSGKLVVLYFYASWCPLCQAEFPKMQAAFNKLTNDQIIGFRVNYNDNDTDENEKDLARQFGVAYQHTKVFIRGNQRLLKAPDSWETERYITEIEKYLK